MLEGKNVFITGAAKGIGRAIALEMAKNGANILINDYSTEKEAEDLRRLILKENVRCELYMCDVSDFEATKKLSEKVLKDFPRIDVLINNAGIERNNSIARMSEGDFDKVIAVNLKGAFNMIKHFCSNFLKNRSGTQ